MERYTVKDVPISWNAVIAIMIHFIMLMVGSYCKIRPGLGTVYFKRRHGVLILLYIFLFPTFNSFRLILQEPSNQSPQPGPSSEPSITQYENKYRCRRCTQRFPDRRQLYLHGMQEHFQSGGGASQARPWEDDQAPGKSKGTID